MRKLRSIAAYTWAAAAVPIVLAAFMGMETWSKRLVAVTGLTVSPWCTGGEVLRTVDHGPYQTSIHRPVFDGLISECSVGFVQVEWGPPDRLPERIEEDIDLDGDGRPEFRVQLVPATAAITLVPYDQRVKKLEGVYRLKRGLAIRIALCKKAEE